MPTKDSEKDPKRKEKNLRIAFNLLVSFSIKQTLSYFSLLSSEYSFFGLVWDFFLFLKSECFFWVQELVALN